MKRLISFLGLGPVHQNAQAPYYASTRYSLDGKESSATPLMDAAVCKLLAPIHSVVHLGTQEVKTRWISTNLVGDYLHHQCRTFLEVPDGSSESDRWKIFKTVCDALSCEPISGLETEAPTEIIFNVTYGYRSHPILGMGAINFVLSEWARLEISKPPKIRVLYGAYDAKKNDDSPAPIWDLTEFVTASRWNSAIDALMRYGRADDLAQIADVDGALRVPVQKQGDAHAHNFSPDFGQQFANAVKTLADDLVLARLANLFKRSAPQLRDVLKGADVQYLVRQLPPLTKTIATLQTWVAPLCAPNVLGEEGLRATVALAERYGHLQRFAEQAATIREGLVTVHAHLQRHLAVHEPGPGCKTARDPIDKDWGRNVRRGKPVTTVRKAPSGYADLSHDVRIARNDIEHCGINDTPQNANSLRIELQRLSANFATLVGALK